MACPRLVSGGCAYLVLLPVSRLCRCSACLNGGGQLRRDVKEGDAPVDREAEARRRLPIMEVRVSSVVLDRPSRVSHPILQALLHDVDVVSFEDESRVADLRLLLPAGALRTRHHAVPELVNPLTVKW